MKFVVSGIQKKLQGIQRSSKIKPIKERKINGKNRPRSDRDKIFCRKENVRSYCVYILYVQKVEENKHVKEKHKWYKNWTSGVKDENFAGWC